MRTSRRRAAERRAVRFPVNPGAAMMHLKGFMSMIALAALAVTVLSETSGASPARLFVPSPRPQPAPDEFVPEMTKAILVEGTLVTIQGGLHVMRATR